MDKKKNESYSQAIARLEKIVALLDSDELEIDELGEKIKEANELIVFCTGRLRKVEGEVGRMLGGEGGGE